MRTAPAPAADGHPPLSRGERLVLGVPSLVLGVVPTLAPRATARALGLGGVAPAVVVRAVGVRELLVALTFLRGRSAGWLWGFVGQDTLDLPVLAWLLASGRDDDAGRLRRTLVAYVAMATVDVSTAVVRDLMPRRRQRRAEAERPSEPSSAL